MQGPPAVVCALVVNCVDPVRAARFWQTMLGGRIVSYRTLGVEALRAPGITFDFVTADESKSTTNRLHLDLATDDPPRAIEQAIANGATRATDFEPRSEFTVMRDPEGNEFCVLSNASAEGPWPLPLSAKP